ncbi:MAG: BolA/IbaG family iron-sulfur metabolism protein [Pseudomonadota bacterium]
MNQRAENLENQLADALELEHLEIIDESGNHNVPAGAQSHFKVIAVAQAFAEVTRIQRHRLINAAVQEEFAQGMHALAIHAYSPAEWQDRFGEAPMSPPCRGGGRETGS